MPKSPEFDFSKLEDQQKFEVLPKKEQKKVISESQSEGNILKGKIELGEVGNFNEALNEFDKELIELTKEKIKKEKIVENFDLRNLRVLDKSADDYNAFDYRYKVSGAGDKLSGMSGGMPGDAYDLVAFAHPDYDDTDRQRQFIREAKGNLIIFEQPNEGSYSEISGSLGIIGEAKIAGINTEDIEHYSEAEITELEELIYDRLKNPHLKDKIYHAYYELFDNQAIVIEGDDYDRELIVRQTIADELKNGVYIVDALKKIEKEGLIKIKHVPSFYTDPQEMKLRENEINAILDERKNNIKAYIKERLEEEIFEKIEQKKKLEAKQELISKKYGEFLETQKTNLSPLVLEKLNEALLRFNNDESHSRVYREYETTKGLDIKDNVAVFIVEEGSLNLQGKGGEEIDIKLVMVDDEKTREAQKFHVRDRWDKNEDDFSKWYDEVKIENIDKSKGLITLRLIKSRDKKKTGDIVKIKLEQK